MREEGTPGINSDLRYPWCFELDTMEAIE